MSDISEAETTTHDLLNQATEWLQYARGLTELLAELVHESDTVDCNRMAMGLEAISALTSRGLAFSSRRRKASSSGSSRGVTCGSAARSTWSR